MNENLPSHEPARGLPPVAPPSGRFLVELFVKPGLIVMVVVGFLLLFNYMTSSITNQSSKYYLSRLDSDNSDIRWRTASDLAQVLLRNEPDSIKLKANVEFALELTERLKTAHDDLVAAEAAHLQKIEKLSAEEQKLSWRKLRSARDHVSFLMSSLSCFHVAVAAPVLCDIAQQDARVQGGVALRKRQAVLALAKLGENVRQFGKLKPELQVLAAEQLNQEAAGNTSRAGWARLAGRYLPGASPAGSDLAVDARLSTLTMADDPFLRTLTALSLSTWPGPQGHAALVLLTRDDGHGQLIRLEEADY